MKIKVCDSLMGSGKTSAAITFMNENPDRKFMFVTPFLSELDRIAAACPDLHFQAPGTYAGRTKSQDIEVLLRAKQNIVTTHTLFSILRAEALDMIRASDYTLILDEVMAVIEVDDMKKGDVDFYLGTGLFEMDEDGEHIHWTGPDDYAGTHATTVEKAKQGNLIYYRNSLLFWSLPINNFAVFREVYVLTYMFHAQMQRYYYDMNGLEYEYIGTEQTESGYRFSPEATIPEYAADLIDHVHILDDPKLNKIGESFRYKDPLKDPTLSSSWYRRSTERGNTNLDLMRRNAANVIRHKFDSVASDYIWTIFKNKKKNVQMDKTKAKNVLSERGFVPCTTRATNEFRDRHNLLYLINLYFEPLILNYFKDHGAEVDEEAYSLSELVQWVWRSAIRCGEDVNIYIPSRRMRALLQEWLERLAAGLPY